MTIPDRTRATRRASILTALLAVLSGCWAPAAAGADWTQWGGPSRDFTVEATGLADQWPHSGPERIWSREIGEGYSGVLAIGRTLFTMYRDGSQEVVISLDAWTGRTFWEHRYDAPPLETQNLEFGKGPNATPLIVGDVVYTVGFTAKMHALDKESGEVLWSHDLIEEFGGKVQEFGYSASPLAFARMVIVLVGGDTHGAIGFDLEDGSVAWQTTRLDISYASPIAIQVDGEEQLVFMTSTEVVGAGLVDGEVKWRWPHANQYKNNCAGPWWMEQGVLFVSSQGDAGGQTLQLKRSDGKTSVERLNSDVKMKIFHSSAVRVGDVIYGGSHSFYTAYDVKAGKTLWKQRGLAEANTVRADGKMILLDQEGRLALATVTPEGMKVHSEVQLLEKRSWTAPTLAGTVLIVRGGGKLMALELKAPPATRATPGGGS